MADELLTNKKIYIAGPISIGDMAVNVRKAIDTADILFRAGLHPFIPHLSCFYQMFYRRDFNEWLSYDEDWLLCCGSLFRIPGESKGSDREVRFANKHGIPVFYYINPLLQAYGLSDCGVIEELVDGSCG